MDSQKLVIFDISLWTETESYYGLYTIFKVLTFSYSQASHNGEISPILSTGLWFHIRAPISRRSSNWIVFDCAWISVFFCYVLSELLPAFCFKSLVCHVLRLPKSCLSKHVCALVHFRNPNQNPLISFKTGSKSHDHTQILALVVVYLNEFNGLFFVVFVVVIIITFLLVLFQKLSFLLLNTCLPLLVSQLLLVVPLGW